MRVASSFGPANIVFVYQFWSSGFFLDKNFMFVKFSTLYKFKITGLSYDEHDRAIQVANT